MNGKGEKNLIRWAISYPVSDEFTATLSVEGTDLWAVIRDSRQILGFLAMEKRKENGKSPLSTD